MIPIAPQSVDIDGLVAWLKSLFDCCDALAAEGRLPYVDAAVAGGTWRLHASDPARLSFILSRLEARSTDGPGGHFVFSLSGRDLGWNVPRWGETDWNFRIFDARLAAAGYKAHYPFFDRDWIVQRRSDAMSIHIVQDWSDLRPWDGGAPLRVIVHWLAQRRGKRLTHAGTLAFGGLGVLLCGKGGSGKSGTVLSGLTQGLGSVGDDYVLLDQTGAPRVEKIYNLMKQDRPGLARFSDLEARFEGLPPNWQGKVEFDPRSVFPSQIVESFDVVAVLLPRVAHSSRTIVRPVSRPEALDRLTRAMEQEFFGETTETLFAMNRLLIRLPVYELSLSTDPAEIAATIRTVIVDEAARSTARRHA